jgi:putative addiction module CopG family antidote
MARFIRGKVKAGQYTNASEVVRDAVRHMQEAEAVRKEQLTTSEYKDIRQRVQQGVKDLEEGRYEEFDEDGLRQHFAGIAERGKKRLAAGVKRSSK